MHYSRMSLDELYGRAGQVKNFIQYLENKSFQSVEDVARLKTQRAIMEALKKEITTRAVQLPLFKVEDFKR